MSQTQAKPIICTFHELSRALRSVHLGVKADVDRLHDVWKMGAPTPGSRVLQPKIYDPRVPQGHLGNFEARIVFPSALAAWAQDVLQRRGAAITTDQALRLVNAISKAWG